MITSIQDYEEIKSLTGPSDKEKQIVLAAVMSTSGLIGIVIASIVSMIFILATCMVVLYCRCRNKQQNDSSSGVSGKVHDIEVFGRSEPNLVKQDSTSALHLEVCDEAEL